VTEGNNSLGAGLPARCGWPDQGRPLKSEEQRQAVEVVCVAIARFFGM